MPGWYSLAGSDQRLHRRYRHRAFFSARKSATKLRPLMMPSSPSTEVVRIGALALLDQIDAGDRARDNLQADLGAVGREPASSGARCRASTSIADAAGSRPACRSGTRSRDAERRDQSNPVCETSFSSHGPAGAAYCASRWLARARCAGRARCRTRPNTASSERAAEALAGVHLEIRIAVLFAQEAGDLGEADDRVDGAGGGRALAAARASGLYSGSTLTAKRLSSAQLARIGALASSERGWLARSSARA